MPIRERTENNLSIAYKWDLCWWKALHARERWQAKTWKNGGGDKMTTGKKGRKHKWEMVVWADNQNSVCTCVYCYFYNLEDQTWDTKSSKVIFLHAKGVKVTSGHTQQWYGLRLHCGGVWGVVWGNSSHIQQCYPESRWDWLAIFVIQSDIYRSNQISSEWRIATADLFYLTCFCTASGYTVYCTSDHMKFLLYIIKLILFLIWQHHL